MNATFGAALAFAMPVALHYAFLWGQRLLEPVATPFSKFDAFYNRRPLLVSFISGAFFAAATLVQRGASSFYSLAAMGLALLILDGLACSISFMLHLKKIRRN